MNFLYIVKRANKETVANKLSKILKTCINMGNTALINISTIEKDFIRTHVDHSSEPI